jgi:hypothetical protein
MYQRKGGIAVELSSFLAFTREQLDSLDADASQGRLATAHAFALREVDTISDTTQSETHRNSVQPRARK